MSWRSPVRGYAAKFGVVTLPTADSYLGKSVPSRRLMFAPGCFDIANVAGVPVWFNHWPSHAVGTGPEIGLELWQDAYGLGFQFVPPPKSHSLVWGIADGRFAECSVTSLIAASEQVGGADGYWLVRKASIAEITIAPKGACPGTACWHSANEPHGIPQNAKTVLATWHAGHAATHSRMREAGASQGVRAIGRSAVVPAPSGGAP